MGTSDGETMAAVDSSWWHMEDPANQMVITAVLTFEDTLSFGAVRALISKRLLVHARFRQHIVEPRLRLGLPRWVTDEQFSLDRHLLEARLPEPAAKAELQQLVGELMSTPLDSARPLWQMHFVERYEGGSALVVRIHHCIADGLALIRLLLTLDDTAGNEDALGSHLNGRFSPVLPPARGASWRDALLAPRTRDHLRMGGKTVGVLTKLLGMRFDAHPELRGALVQAKHAAWSEPFPLAEVKRIGKRTGTTINDVLTAAVAGALQEYLRQRGSSFRRSFLRAVVPVNLRRTCEVGELGNRFGLVYLPLPLTGSVMEQLKAVKRNMDRLKRSPEPVVLYAMLMLFGGAPKLAVSLITAFLGAKASLVMTDVPGPREPIYFCGVRMSGLMAWVPQAGRLALGVSVLSYAGEVRVGIAADAERLPDPQRIVDAYMDALRQLSSHSADASAQPAMAPMP
jgi:diacylglycerol O-acyltransferase / wax synthase